MDFTEWHDLRIGKKNSPIVRIKKGQSYDGIDSGDYVELKHHTGDHLVLTEPEMYNLIGYYMAHLKDRKPWKELTRY